MGRRFFSCALWGAATPLTALGGYTPHTPAARADARVKLILLLLATVGVFSAQSSVVLLAWAVVLFGALGAARMRPSRILRAMQPVAIVLAFTLIANLVSCDGRATIELAGPVGLDPAGGLRGPSRRGENRAARWVLPGGGRVDDGHAAQRRLRAPAAPVRARWGFPWVRSERCSRWRCALFRW